MKVVSQSGLLYLVAHGLEQVVSKEETMVTAAICNLQGVLWGNGDKPTSITMITQAHKDEAAKRNGIIDEVFYNDLDLKVINNTGHVPHYPARQYCAHCNAALFTAEGLARCPKS